MTADGVQIATTKPSNDLYKYQRTYPDGPVYAPVTGYDTIFTQSQAPNYATGVEHAENSLLTGTGSQLAFRNFIDMITNKPQKGATVQLTINSKAQQAAYQQLQAILQGKTINGKQQVGGVVALNPTTGAILAMASYPSYDPNQLAVHDTTKLNKIDSKLSREDPSPLLNNATQTTLPPGSTFKIVTSSAWFTQDADPEPEYHGRLPAAADAAQREHAEQRQQRAVRLPGRARPRSTARSPSPATPRSPSSACSSAARRIKSMADAFGLNNPSALDIPGVTVAPVQLHRRGGQVVHRLRRDRPARHHGDAAAGGDVRGDGRQRRHADEAVPGPAGHRQRPVGGRADPGAAAQPADHPARSPATRSR